MLTTWIDTGGVTGLTPNTTYAYQVKSTDIYNRNTAWSTAISTTLAAVPPMPLINQVVNSSMSITVLPNPSNPYYTQYAVAFTSSGPTQYLNTSGALGFSLVFASTAAWNTYTSAGPLTPNTTFNIGVVAENLNGVQTSYSVIATTVTLSNPPLASAYGVWITSITANWQNNGNPAGTYYTAQNMTIGASSTTLYNVSDKHRPCSQYHLSVPG